MSDLRRIAEAATPGPWTTWTDRGEHGICTEDGKAEISSSGADATFIATFHPDRIKAMLNKLEECGVDLDEL